MIPLMAWISGAPGLNSMQHSVMGQLPHGMGVSMPARPEDALRAAHSLRHNPSDVNVQSLDAAWHDHTGGGQDMTSWGSAPASKPSYEHSLHDSNPLKDIYDNQNTGYKSNSDMYMTTAADPNPQYQENNMGGFNPDMGFENPMHTSPFANAPEKFREDPLDIPRTLPSFEDPHKEYSGFTTEDHLAYNAGSVVAQKRWEAEQEHLDMVRDLESQPGFIQPKNKLVDKNSIDRYLDDPQPSRDLVTDALEAMARDNDLKNRFDSHRFDSTMSSMNNHLDEVVKYNPPKKNNFDDLLVSPSLYED